MLVLSLQRSVRNCDHGKGKALRANAFSDREIRLTASGLASLRGLRLLFRELSFSAQGGQFLVLRGPNGSGKSTLLRMMAGLIRPSAGTLSLTAPGGERVHYLGHADGLKPFETPRTALASATRHAGVRPQADAIAAALHRLGLERPADVPARLLSAGQKRRTALARLLLVSRPVWLLDEPFASLDAAGQACAEAMIAEQLGQGGLVVAALHGPCAIPASQTLDFALAGVSGGAVA